MLQINPTLVETMREHAEDAYPHECCGALLGTSEGNGRNVVTTVAVENRREGPAARRRFLITADDYRALEARAREASLDVLGFYHSHPDHPARPSEYDRDHALPWYSYVIIAVEKGQATDMASWILQDDRSAFLEEDIA